MIIKSVLYSSYLLCRSFLLPEPAGASCFNLVLVLNSPFFGKDVNNTRLALKLWMHAAAALPISVKRHTQCASHQGLWHCTAWHGVARQGMARHGAGVQPRLAASHAARVGRAQLVSFCNQPAAGRLASWPTSGHTD